MTFSKKSLFFTFILLINSISFAYGKDNPAQAQNPELGLEKLIASLSYLNTQNSVSVSLDSTFTDIHDDKTKQGQVTVWLSASEQGFQFVFPPAELEKIAQEKQQLAQLTDLKNQDTDSITPTTAAANKLRAIELNKTLNIASELSFLIKRAQFLPEQSNYSSNQAQSILSFSLPIEMMLKNKRTRNYVDDFKANYRLFINSNGVPLKSELSFEGSGSAYLVLHIKAYGAMVESYQVVNNRLILAESESVKGSQSLFGDFERKQTKSLRLFNDFNN